MLIQNRMTLLTGRSRTLRKLALILPLVFASCAVAQNAPSEPPKKPAPCVIFASAEPATGMATWSLEGRARKHLLTYLAGDYPEGMPFRSSIKDKDVDKIKARGGKVIILDPHYTRDDLDKAKAECRNQPAPPASSPEKNETTPTPSPTPSPK